MPKKHKPDERIKIAKKSDFAPPASDVDEGLEPLPAQEEFWRPPVRFGSIPVEKEPLGWDRRGYRKLFLFTNPSS